MIWAGFLGVECKNFLKILLEIYNKCENSIVLESTSEMPRFFDKNFVKVRVKKLELIKQITGK